MKKLNPSTLPFTHPHTHPPTHPSILHSSIYEYTYPFICLSIYPSTYECIYPLIHPAIYLSMNLCIHPSIHLSFYLIWPEIPSLGIFSQNYSFLNAVQIPTQSLCSNICSTGNSLEVQWLGLHASMAGGTSSIPGWETKILQALGVAK